MTAKKHGGSPSVLWVLVLAAVLLLGCGGPRIRPEISDRATSLRYPESRYRTVLHGDTLYSIAWESGRDYRELAEWNGIAPPYTIKPGRRLRLFPSRKEQRTALNSSGARPAQVDSKRSQSRYPVKANSAYRPSRSIPRPAPLSAAGASDTAAGPWVWPATGKIVARFNHTGTENGLDIAGWRGEPVVAAAAGKVVYQGSGLRGYGQLIIIKHNDEYLSAYAHNNRILVKDGELVKRGQKIAEMGDTGTDRVKLHFEIRRHGSPVDPLRYLPKL